MTFIFAALVVAPVFADTLVLEERIDLYDQVSMEYLGAELTWFGARGQRLRLENRDAEGALTLLFVIRHDEQGREAEAVYFESDSQDADREVFTYSPDGRLKTTTYFYEPGIPSDRTESDLDESGREIRKRYFRGDGTQYGEEDVSWTLGGAKAGWDFRYVERAGGAAFSYQYAGPDDETWVQRVRLRDRVPERVEVRSVLRPPARIMARESAPFAPGVVSTDDSEASPSFSADGRVMVFARYGEDWTEKTAHIGRLTSSGWEEETLEHLGPVYNLAISPDAHTIVFSRRTDDVLELLRTTNDGSRWSRPESLTDRYGLRGSYPFLTDSGDLVFFDSDGEKGSGLYLARSSGLTFGSGTPLFISETGVAFDAYFDPNRNLVLVTQCFDDLCESGQEHGIWEIGLGDDSQRQLDGLPYAWGVQPVPELGLLVFTDGDDIRAVPLDVWPNR